MKTEQERREDLAWAAGFFDGEGCTIYIRRVLPTGTAQRAISMQVCQVGRPLLSRFRAAVGIGTVKGPYRQRNPNGRPYWTYRVSGIDNVRTVSERLWPWLGEEKKKQIAVAIERWINFVPQIAPCVHGVPYKNCHPCRVASANKAWITRRRAG